MKKEEAILRPSDLISGFSDLDTYVNGKKSTFDAGKNAHPEPILQPDVWWTWDRSAGCMVLRCLLPEKTLLAQKAQALAWIQVLFAGSGKVGWLAIYKGRNIR